MTTGVQALSATISHAVTQVVEQALGKVNKETTPVFPGKALVEAVEASVQDEVSVLTQGTATNFTAQLLALPFNCEPFASISWL